MNCYVCKCETEPAYELKLVVPGPIEVAFCGLTCLKEWALDIPQPKVNVPATISRFSTWERRRERDKSP